MGVEVQPWVGLWAAGATADAVESAVVGVAEWVVAEVHLAASLTASSLRMCHHML